MRVKKMSATTALVATMSCGQAMLPASAVTVPEEVSVPSPVQEDVDLQAVEAEVTTIFERYLQQDSEGRWSVNVEAVRQDGAPEADLQRIAERFNVPIGKYALPGSEDKGAGGKGASPQHQFGSGEWGKCVLNRVVPGIFEADVGGGGVALPSKGKYAQVASYLIRVVGPTALKGGVAVLVASLAVIVAWCSTPWVS